MGEPDDWTTYLAIRAAWLSFVGGCTQGEIASRLDISPAKVHRLIAYAQRAGHIRFHIEGRPLECLEYEETFARAFGLNHCIVAPDLGTGVQDEGAAIRSVGAAAGNLLAQVLASSGIRQIGVGMGRTLKAAVAAMPRISREDLSIVSISGSLTSRLSANPYDVVQLLAERSGGEGYYLPVPYLATTVAEKEMFLQQPSVQELLARARRSDTFVVGIGSISDDGHLRRMNLISRDEQRALQKLGAVGDLMGRFIDIDGAAVPAVLSEQAVGLGFEEVRGARVLALSGGVSKTAATLSALRTGVITDLVIDEALAKSLASEIGAKTPQPA
ncbi:DNA-binding transcriptional regulator LsrR (DeoR family) [Breoghania corrubedonensis]|uniref:DNA-binding transcriptional regulator LsrR (DeoR family) n=1 Tax=Breoghania corrubedonensis TaxID=665038 RepID=A0A2T5VFH3_9HYPH|nr:sugar-binding transcriptional regulator [Breoghania corrubedonensis]PTW62511.1 DNA-binding transcriptional regulator LsrR (DeoR family) [Breoghania corrubedonensis]